MTGVTGILQPVSSRLGRAALRIALPLILLGAVGGCSKSDQDAAAPNRVPWVKTVAVQAESQSMTTLSGTVRARYETPIAFQVNGRILSREVDAGHRVKSGDLLFRLDPRDLDEAERAAAAQLAGADAFLQTQQKGLERRRQLSSSDAVSLEELERAELAERDAVSRRDAARAALAQARNARTYGQLRAKHSGVLTEVTGEPGQVVNAGQSIAVLAQEGEREVEVFLADGSAPPRQATMRLAQGETMTLALREVAGAADPVSRTWRARYRIETPQAMVPLGTVVHVALPRSATDGSVLTVPVGALDERSAGPQVWVIKDGKAQPQPVTVLGLRMDHARIKADIPPGTRVIALGTHLLTPGMDVRERAP